MQTILFIILLFSTPFETFKQDEMIDHYLQYHKIDTCNFNVRTHEDMSFSVYYNTETIIHVNKERINIYLSDFDFYNDLELNQFIHFFIYNYIFDNEYVYIEYTDSKDDILNEFEIHLETLMFLNMSINGTIFNTNGNTKLWTSNMALNNNQIITCIENIKKQ